MTDTCWAWVNPMDVTQIKAVIMNNAALRDGLIIPRCGRKVVWKCTSWMLGWFTRVFLAENKAVNIIRSVSWNQIVLESDNS